MNQFTVIDVLTKQEFPAVDYRDVEYYVDFILQAQSLTEYEEEQREILLSDVREVGSAYSHNLELEVVSHV